MGKVKSLAHDAMHIRGKQLPARSGGSREDGQMRRREAPGQERAKASDIPPTVNTGERKHGGT